MYNDLIDFINMSPTSFHAISSFKSFLDAEGYKDLLTNEIKPGNNYYIIRNESSIIAIRIPLNFNNKLNIISSHSDSPNYKIKFNPNLCSKEYALINVGAYGGMIHSSFLDRPLSIAGRVSYSENNEIKTKLISFDRPVAIIPNLAIHLNPDANNGYKYAMGKDMQPLYSLSERNLISDIEKEFEVKNILAHDLYVVSHQPGYVWGHNNEFITSPRLDNLECAYTSMNALVESDPKSISICAVFDNEEVGSLSYMGASSDFMESTINIIFDALNISKKEKFTYLSNSITISADNAHALHPNYVEKYDSTNTCKMNKGPVIKFSNNQSYTTDGTTAAYFMDICKKAAVPYQVFENHPAVRGGSTLGNLLNYHTSIKSVDVGLAQLAMHSSVETGGSKDAEYLFNSFVVYYNN